MELDSQIELYDSDLVKIREVFHKLNDKYSSKRDTRENLLSLVHEAEDLFEQVGFVVTVALPKSIRAAMGMPIAADTPSLMTFSIEERVDPLEFDFDRQGWEVKHQLIDDKVASKFLEQGGTEKQPLDIKPVQKD